MIVMVRRCGRLGNAGSDARGEDGHITRVRCVLVRHKAANWGGLGRWRKPPAWDSMAS
jgi:hypothetical protein